MYRQLIPLLLCASTALAAPQKDSNITYVKQQTELEHSPVDLKPSERESRIEKVPLTIPGKFEKNEKNPVETPDNNEEIQTAQTTDRESTYNYPDRIYSIKTKPKNSERTTEKYTHTDEDENNKPKVNNSDAVAPSETKDIFPAESILNNRVATNENTELSSEKNIKEIDEFVTENYSEDTNIHTVIEEEITKAPEKKKESSGLLPKSRYFEKSTYSFSHNLIANPVKRRFRSRCKCERIWNCAKLQISVPRCPEEYFLCCS